MMPYAAAALLALAASSAAAARYSIAPESSAVKFRVRHLLVNRVYGEFKSLRGAFDYDPADPSAWRVQVEVDAASIDTGIRKRDAHLRSEDFLFVSSHPALGFVSESVEPLEEGRFAVRGTLSIRGVARPAVLRVETLEPREDRPRFRATTAVDRTAFGVADNDKYRAGAAAIGRQIAVEIEMEGLQLRQDERGHGEKVDPHQAR